MLNKTEFIILLIILLVLLYYSKCEWINPEYWFNTYDLFSVVDNSKSTASTVNTESIVNTVKQFSEIDLNLIPKPQIINPGKKIAFVYLYTLNISDYASHSIKNLTDYVIKQGYTLIIYDKIIESNVYPCWNKVLAILANLKNYDYVVWFDADAIISNRNKRIEDFINLQPDKDLLLCFDCVKDRECINSGVMIIANTDWAYNLFVKTWNNPIPHHHNDQRVLYHEILKESHPESEPLYSYFKICDNIVHPKVYIFPENQFNSHIDNYLLNDFVIHLMGLDKTSRINIMRQINTKLGLDNYEQDDCVKLIEKLGYPELKGKDKDTQIEKNCYTGRN